LGGSKLGKHWMHLVVLLMLTRLSSHTQGFLFLMSGAALRTNVRVPEPEYMPPCFYDVALWTVAGMFQV
jgi:hypothetical protein